MSMRKAMAVALSPPGWTIVCVIAVASLSVIELGMIQKQTSPLVIISSTIGYSIWALGLKLLWAAMYDRFFPFSRQELPFLSMILLVFCFVLVGGLFLIPLLNRARQVFAP